MFLGLGLSLCVAAACVTNSRAGSPLPLQIGIDRSNMATEWTLAPPAEPGIYPFNGPYNGPGVFEARRTAVFTGLARLHVQWFRDGFGPDTPQSAQLFVDAVRQVHANGMKLLAVVGPAGSDFDPGERIDPTTSGCQWGTYPLSKIDLAKFEHRLRTHFDAVKAAGLTVDAFEAGNELDLYCNDADMPKTSEFAAHNWKWFLSQDQIHAFAAGYAPFLATYVRVVRAYFPHAAIITFGMSNPSGNSAALIQALAHFTDSAGRTFDYTSLVDGYGTHLYSSSATTLEFITRTTEELSSQAALLPHIKEKPMWITEWNESGSAFWSSKKWFFAPGTRNGVAVDLNQADDAGRYPAMTRAEVINAFMKEVITPLRSGPVNIATLFYYSYDSAGASAMCDETVFHTSRGLTGTCFSGVIDPVTGDLLPDVTAALTGNAITH